MISHELSGRYFQLENPESIGIVYIVWQCFLLLKLLIKFHFKSEIHNCLGLFGMPMALKTYSGKNMQWQRSIPNQNTKN